MKRTSNIKSGIYHILNLGLGDQPKEEDNLEWKTTSKNESGTTDLIAQVSLFLNIFITNFLYLYIFTRQLSIIWMLRNPKIKLLDEVDQHFAFHFVVVRVLLHQPRVPGSIPGVF